MESLISSSSASTSRRKCKGEWTSNLYFYPDVDDHGKESEFVITQDELLAWQKVQKLFGEDEDIKKVKVYSNPLFSIQLGKGPLHHATVLFQTKNSGTWWSIEKNTKSITIQTSKNGPEPVRKYYNRIQRPEGPMAPNTKDRTAGRLEVMYAFINSFIIFVTKNIWKILTIFKLPTVNISPNGFLIFYLSGLMTVWFFYWNYS